VFTGVGLDSRDVARAHKVRRSLKKNQKSFECKRTYRAELAWPFWGRQTGIAFRPLAEKFSAVTMVQ
jgi:hypothetical protein